MSSSKVAHIAGNNAHAPWSWHAGGFCLICEASLFEASEEACCHGHLSPASGAQIKFYMYRMTKWQEPWLEADDRSPSSGQCQAAHIYKQESKWKQGENIWKQRTHSALQNGAISKRRGVSLLIPHYFFRHWKSQTFSINFLVKYSCILVWVLFHLFLCHWVFMGSLQHIKDV